MERLSTALPQPVVKDTELKTFGTSLRVAELPQAVVGKDCALQALVARRVIYCSADELPPISGAKKDKINAAIRKEGLHGNAQEFVAVNAGKVVSLGIQFYEAFGWKQIQFEEPDGRITTINLTGNHQSLINFAFQTALNQLKGNQIGLGRENWAVSRDWQVTSLSSRGERTD